MRVPIHWLDNDTGVACGEKWWDNSNVHDLHADLVTCPQCLAALGRTHAAPAQNLDGLAWQSEPPDAKGFWFLRQTGCKPFCCWVENLHAETGGWSEDWSCAPCPPL